ncbi:hypothetical protein H2199_004591 [Coniosporium tulheliwenetii]|uniref:Uncharacterized protein n=1 Tax=Coniosporium tulheliwenetii TaxID=3383036 RepID=A0ACC2Z5Y2_9PEZI|nr:hypothetical protein H2199_004591 [Cladosporium sp. JES 115]
MPSPPRQLPIRLHHILAQQNPTAAAHPQMASREPPRRTTTASGVRRNLFQHAASRRPATTASSTSGTSVTTLQVAPEEANADIAVRDEHGNYQLEQPAMTPMGRDEGRDEREVDHRLIEAYRKRQQHIEPHELKATLQASLLAKVASLDDDKWMFEAEGPMSS